MMCKSRQLKRTVNECTLCFLRELEYKSHPVSIQDKTVIPNLKSRKLPTIRHNWMNSIMGSGQHLGFLQPTFSSPLMVHSVIRSGYPAGWWKQNRGFDLPICLKCPAALRAGLQDPAASQNGGFRGIQQWGQCVWGQDHFLPAEGLMDITWTELWGKDSVSFSPWTLVSSFPLPNRFLKNLYIEKKKSKRTIKVASWSSGPPICQKQHFLFQ